MSTKNPRLNVVLEPPVYSAVRNLAQKEGISLSLKARDLIRLALEYYEDIHWTKEALKREATFNKKTALSHKAIWA
jgi:hypothetical protein